MRHQRRFAKRYRSSEWKLKSLILRDEEAHLPERWMLRDGKPLCMPAVGGMAWLLVRSFAYATVLVCGLGFRIHRHVATGAQRQLRFLRIAQRCDNRIVYFVYVDVQSHTIRAV